ncbi:MAG: ABC transporter six-transmembrane domain-containing protein [Pseudomonadota bacterium]
MLKDEPVTISTLLRRFLRSILLTWVLTLCETTLLALVPLFIGFAIDGLLHDDTTALLQLGAVLAGLIAVGVVRRIYDTRTYGTIRVEVGKAQVERSAMVTVSTLNARLGMGRELVDFLEREVPAIMDSAVQLTISFVVLWFFHAILSFAALGAAVLMIAFYSLVHGRFYRLNADHNHQTEQQVRILEARRSEGILSHLTKLRQIEIRLSDTEAFVYGAIFTALLGFVIFNLWFSATNIETTVGTIFSIITYSWQFVDSALVLPVTLQGWSRLSEIIKRINKAA